MINVRRLLRYVRFPSYRGGNIPFWHKNVWGVGGGGVKGRRDGGGMAQISTSPI